MKEMKLIALKPCSFGGIRYYRGDEIPTDAVCNPKVQEKRGTILIVSDDKNDIESDNAREEMVPSGINVPIVMNPREITYMAFTAEDVADIFLILQMPATEAAKAIESEESVELLTAIQHIDGRSPVKKAVANMLKVLDSENHTEENQEPSNQGDKTKGDSSESDM